jgi:hypothetical protein
MSTVVGNLSVELGISDDQLRAGLASAMAQAQQAGQRISNSLNQAEARPGVKPQGLLAVSRAVDDMQYGFRGVINNIEGIVTGLGMGAGVAGAATIAAVAISALGPKIAEVAKSAFGLNDPFIGLKNALKEIESSGAAGTFVGMAENARATKNAFEAAVERLKDMKVNNFTPQQMVGPGPGLGGLPVFIRNDQEQAKRDIENQRRSVNRLAQDAALTAFQATQANEAVTSGGLARFDLTQSQRIQENINKQIFQATVDKFGGGAAVQSRLNFLSSEDVGMYGRFKQGDLKTTDEVVNLLGLQAEKTKILADDWERVTGQAAELRRIEEEAQKEKEQRDKQRLALQEKADKFRASIDETRLRQQRTEIIGASDVFQRNFMAGTSEDPTVKAIEKQTEDLREIMQQIKELN